MRGLTTVNLGHNSNTIPTSFWAIPRSKKSNYITVPESQEGRRANTHSFCALTETILRVEIMPSKNSNNLFPIKCYHFTKKPLQHNDATATNLELIYHYNKSD